MFALVIGGGIKVFRFRVDDLSDLVPALLDFAAFAISASLAVIYSATLQAK